MGNPLVSIIIPNYNYARYLKERMDSVIGQTFQDYEIILLDDASTDGSAEMLKEYATNDKVAHLVINEKNTGSPFAQWRRGFELARGKYIWIAESDDSASPKLLERCISVLESDEGINLCMVGSHTVNGEGELIDRDYDRWSEDPRMLKRLHTVRVFDGVEYVKHNLYWCCSVYNASATVFRRSAVTSEMFDESAGMRNSGDWLFWVKVTGKGKIAEIYDKLNIIRRHDSAVTEVGVRSGYILFEDIKVIKYIESHFNVGLYRRTIRRGTFIKEVLRSKFPQDVKDDVLAFFFSTLGSSMLDYRLERVHKTFFEIIPGLISLSRDRI